MIKYTQKRRAIYLEDSPLKIGNGKLGYDTLIINMGSAEQCPSNKLGLCTIGERCYSRNLERLFKGVAPRNVKSGKWWLNTPINEQTKYIRGLIKEFDLKYIRFNEAGDFWSQLCVERLKLLASQLKSVIVYTYTHRSDLEFNDLPKNLVINGSTKVISNHYKVIPLKDFKTFKATKGVVKCINNCVRCAHCKITSKKIIVQGLHK